MSGQTKPLTVLLVDDDKTIVDIFKYGLSGQGYEVHTAYSVAEALRVANTLHIDCLLSDIQLPDQDGITLNKLIKEIYPDIISILMTGYPGISSAIQGLRQNIHDYLIKPFSVEQAIASIERALGNAEMERQNQKHLQRISELEAEVEELRAKLDGIPDQEPSSERVMPRRNQSVDQAAAHKLYMEQQGRLKQ